MIVPLWIAKILESYFITFFAYDDCYCNVSISNNLIIIGKYGELVEYEYVVNLPLKNYVDKYVYNIWLQQKLYRREQGLKSNNILFT